MSRRQRAPLLLTSLMLWHVMGLLTPPDVCSCVVASETTVSLGVAVELSSVVADGCTAAVVPGCSVGLGVVVAQLLVFSGCEWLPSSGVGVWLV